MNPSTITRRSFIKRSTTTAVAMVFAVQAFDAYSITDEDGSCFCWKVTLNKDETLTVTWTGVPRQNPEVQQGARATKVKVGCPDPLPDLPITGGNMDFTSEIQDNKLIFKYKGVGNTSTVTVC